MRAQWEDGHLWTRKWPCQTLNLQAPSSPELWDMKMCCLSHLVCGVSVIAAQTDWDRHQGLTWPRPPTRAGYCPPHQFSAGAFPAAVSHESTRCTQDLAWKGLDAAGEPHTQEARPLHQPHRCVYLWPLWCVCSNHCVWNDPILGPTLPRYLRTSLF